MFECAAAGQRVVYRWWISASSKRPANTATRLRHVQATVDVDRFTSDIRRSITHEKRNQLCDFLDVSHAPERNTREHRLLLLVRERLSHVVSNEPRRDRIHRDVARPDFLRE